LSRVFLALGSNLGDRAQYLASARSALDAAGVQVIRQSKEIDTEPVGITDQPRFLNQVVEAETDLEPEVLLRTVKEIEQRVGRTPGPRWGPREIDVDILLYADRQVSGASLRIPHPELRNRPFLVELLRELGQEVA
jgi:2-amino-4-hydroxy-6-hydroxymethyldihydropteridine diphosphokinase